MVRKELTIVTDPNYRHSKNVFHSLTNTRLGEVSQLQGIGGGWWFRPQGRQLYNRKKYNTANECALAMVNGFRK